MYQYTQETVAVEECIGNKRLKLAACVHDDGISQRILNHTIDIDLTSHNVYFTSYNIHSQTYMHNHTNSRTFIERLNISTKQGAFLYTFFSDIQ